MPAPPAVSCASDGASALCALPQYKSGGDSPFNAASFAPSSKAFATALCALRQGICSLRNYKTGGFSLCVCVVWAGKVENSFSRGFIYGGSFPDPFDSAQQRGGGGLLRRQRHLLLPRALCRRVFARCGITKRAVFPFTFAWCGQAKSKIRSHGVLFTAGVFPILSIAHSQEGGAVCSVVKGICYCPVRFAAGILLVAELTKRTVLPVGNGGGVQNFRQKAKSWSKVWANCRNRAQNY